MCDFFFVCSHISFQDSNDLKQLLFVEKTLPALHTSHCYWVFGGNTAVNMLSGLQTKPGLSQSKFWPELAWSLQTEGLLHMSNQNQMLCVLVVGTLTFKYDCRCLWGFFVILVGILIWILYVWNMSQIWAIFWYMHENRENGKAWHSWAVKLINRHHFCQWPTSSGQEYGIKVSLSVRKRSTTGSLLDDLGWQCM